MARCSEHHVQVNELGIGRCSVPMWLGGMPAGFCDEPAYGEPTPEGRRYYDGYVPGLACAAHGGPRSRVFRDGNAWCAVKPDFINLQESPAGFGGTPEEARAALLAAEAGKEKK